ncbi:hypothetical protein MMC17_000602 [Xylographa soralifera]|nr:hypothetical protein [Xylographa soralifera]
MTSSFPDLLVSCSKSKNKDQVTTKFSDGTFVFHSQWLHDACRTDGPSRNIDTAFCQSISTSYAAKIQICGHGIDQTLNVTWDNGKTSRFPTIWLRVIAPVVASSQDSPLLNQPPLQDGWLVDTLKIPEISYRDIFPEDPSAELRDDIRLRVIDAVVGPGDPGIIKVVDLPTPNIEQERGTKSNLVTSILKQLFGST